jgi:hypothetical protein
MARRRPPSDNRGEWLASLIGQARPIVDRASHAVNRLVRLRLEKAARECERLMQVERKGVEPSTSALRTQRSPN